MRRVARFCLFALLALPAAATPQTVTRTVGQLALTADLRQAFPGGVLVADLRRSLGGVFAILNGRRVQFLDSPHGPRALVPIPVGTPPGPATLGIEVWARRGRQRVAVDVTIAPRSYGSRTPVLPDAKRGLLSLPSAVPDGRRLLLALRTVTHQQLWRGPFQPPVSVAPVASFGLAESWPEGLALDLMTDAIYGEYHRGLDYPAGANSIALAPAAGVVVLAGPLALTGQTLVIDHGLGVVSVFYHLGRIDLREGDAVAARTPLGLVGDTGIAAEPHLHWGVYVNGVAVDPNILLTLPE